MNENIEVKEIEVVDVEVKETETKDKEWVMDKEGNLIPKWLYLRSLQQAG